MLFAKTLAVLLASAACASATGPLRVHPENPRYFTDGSGRAIYLTGSHTWLNIQDAGEPFDFEKYLDFLERHNHNFTRLWAWESPLWVTPDSRLLRLAPLPYARTGPGRAFDGRPRFDLTRFDPAYFDRLWERVAAAAERGIYVSVMLFQGFSVARKSRRRFATPWMGHPFRKPNNVNGLHADADGDEEGYEIHTLADPRVTRLQEAYVRQVIDTLNGFDNVIYEISNESHGPSAEWQYHMIRFIHRYEASKPKQHLVWMSYPWDGLHGLADDRLLFDSPAEIVSPRGGRVPIYRTDPPVADGAKIVIADTDHLWGIGGNRAWVWKSFLRGLHPIFMDPYKNSPYRSEPELESKWDPIRRAMGDTLRFARRLELASMLPSDDPEVCSTRYCLRESGKAYLVYQPDGGPFRLAVEVGAYRAEWFRAATGRTVIEEPKRYEGGSHTFHPPFEGDVVLLLTAASGER